MHILEIVDKDNLVEDLDEQTLTDIGDKVVTEYDIDKKSMSEWMDMNQLAFSLIDLKPEQVTDPWPGASNTKLPLVLNAAIRASAEEFGEIMRGNDIVQSKIYGSESPEKIQRSMRVEEAMNYQFFHELEDWEEDHDKLIMQKNIVGTVHKKLFYADGKIQCVLRPNGIVINDSVEKITQAPRVTDEIYKYGWEVQEKVLNGEWVEVELNNSSEDDQVGDDQYNLFLEQVRRVDLDEDGYAEPYIVTVHAETKQVVRITPNFTPESIQFQPDDMGQEFDYNEYRQLDDKSQASIQKTLTVQKFDTLKSRVRYVKYSMLDHWDGGYWGVGFGILLGPLNENCNTLVNQLLNQGHLAAKGGGFINSGIKMKSGALTFRANEWKKVQAAGMDLSRNIVPLPVKEPSGTLFSLLGTLMEVLKELSSVTEVMSGQQPKSNMPAASIDMLIEQGRKMFNSIYKRHYRSLSKEQNALYDLLFLYGNPMWYVELLDIDLEQSEQEPLDIMRADFSRQGYDIEPTANPEFSTRVQRFSNAQALMQLKDDPRVNGSAILKDYAEVVTDDAEVAAKYVPEQPNMTPEQVQQQMQQQMQEFMNQAEVQTKQLDVQIKTLELQIKQTEAQAQPFKMQADKQKHDADLEKKTIDLEMRSVDQEIQRDSAMTEQELNDQEIDKGELELQKMILEIRKLGEEIQKVKESAKPDYVYKDGQLNANSGD